MKKDFFYRSSDLKPFKRMVYSFSIFCLALLFQFGNFSYGQECGFTYDASMACNDCLTSYTTGYTLDTEVKTIPVVFHYIYSDNYAFIDLNNAQDVQDLKNDVIDQLANLFPLG